jgi:HD-GYP domain-containing protein (c-di-GMP phosphodiesterase class II)
MGDQAKRAKGLELLLQLSLEICSQRDLKSVLERVWKELTRVLEAERSSIFLLDEESKELQSVVAQEANQIRFHRQKGIAGRVLATGLPMLIPDAYADPRFNPEIDRITGFRTRSILAVPMKGPSGSVLGVAEVLNRKDGNPFDEEDLALLEALAGIAAVAIETVQLYEEQLRATEAVIAALVKGLEMRTETHRAHASTVRELSSLAAKAMGLEEARVKLVEWAASLHDLGKLAVPDAVLRKRVPLTPEERLLYEEHALWTKKLLELMDFSGDLAAVVKIAPFHHKEFQGGGFPQGPPEGTDVPLEARIIGAADTLWCKMNPRFGESPTSLQEALAYLRQEAGRKFDPEVVESFLGLQDELSRCLGEAAAGGGEE